MTFELRRFIYDHIVEHGLPPSLDRIGARFGWPTDRAREAVRTMNIGKAVLPHPETGEIWMAGPFASERTAYEIRDTGSGIIWWANCAWDMLGVAALIDRPVELTARCGDCGETLHATAKGARVSPAEYVAHFYLPASEWYHDIGFT